jgi:hypothetical protein
VYQTTDGTCTLTEKQLVNLAIKAFDQTGLIPSTDVWGVDGKYASASGAMIQAFGEFPQVTNKDWLNGFDLGFAQCDQYDSESLDILFYDQTKEFVRGFNMGCVVFNSLDRDLWQEDI